MTRMFFRISAIALLMTTFACAQSLGDVARENREKKAQNAPAEAPKVIGNNDLPKDPDAESQSVEQDDETTAEAVPNNGPSAQQSARRRAAEQKVANGWQRQIAAQKNKVAVLQARIDELNASMTSEGGSVQYEPPYNRPRVRRMRRIAEIQQRLDVETAKLADMQEAARHAGMHTVVYDP